MLRLTLLWNASSQMKRSPMTPATMPPNIPWNIAPCMSKFLYRSTLIFEITGVAVTVNVLRNMEEIICMIPMKNAM